MKLSPKFLFVVVAFAAVMGGVFFMAGGPEKIAPSGPAGKTATFVKPDAVAPATSSPTDSAAPAALAVATQENVQAGKVENSEEAKEKIIATIDDASVLYGPEGLPKIQPYLLHGDPEVRTAAIDGMVNLGEAGGAALLRAAANLAPTAEDAAAMREAAAYLDLPPGQLPKLRAPSN